MKRYHLNSAVFVMVLLAGIALNVSSASAQSEKLLDLMGLWKYSQGDCRLVYQLIVKSGNMIELTYKNSVCEDGSMEANAKKYSFALNGRSLVGTVAVSITQGVGPCTRGFPRRIFPAKGRISPDWSAIAVIDSYPQTNFTVCDWTDKKSDRIMQFTRHR